MFSRLVLLVVNDLLARRFLACVDAYVMLICTNADLYECFVCVNACVCGCLCV